MFTKINQNLYINNRYSKCYIKMKSFFIYKIENMIKKVCVFLGGGVAFIEKRYDFISYKRYLFIKIKSRNDRLKSIKRNIKCMPF